MHLRSYIGRDRAKLTALARAIGVSDTTIYRYMSGDRMPRPDLMRAIEVQTKGQVTPADFYQPVTPPATEAA